MRARAGGLEAVWPPWSYRCGAAAVELPPCASSLHWKGTWGIVRSCSVFLSSLFPSFCHSRLADWDCPALSDGHWSCVVRRGRAGLDATRRGHASSWGGERGGSGGRCVFDFCRRNARPAAVLVRCATRTCVLVVVKVPLLAPCRVRAPRNRLFLPFRWSLHFVRLLSWPRRHEQTFPPLHAPSRRLHWAAGGSGRRYDPRGHGVGQVRPFQSCALGAVRCALGCSPPRHSSRATPVRVRVARCRNPPRHRRLAVVPRRRYFSHPKHTVVAVEAQSAACGEC